MSPNPCFDTLPAQCSCSNARPASPFHVLYETHTANLALSLAMMEPTKDGSRLRVGLLDLDIFGPSIPKLMGLESSNEPELTKGGFGRPWI